jgi:hypothetical protein
MNSFWASDLWGWQFALDGCPWVAHRVCAIEVCVTNDFVKSTLDSEMSFLSPATLPTSLTRLHTHKPERGERRSSQRRAKKKGGRVALTSSSRFRTRRT